MVVNSYALLYRSICFGFGKSSESSEIDDRTAFILFIYWFCFCCTYYISGEDNTTKWVQIGRIYTSTACLFLQVAKYRRGKTKVLNLIVRQVQTELDGRGDGRTVEAILLHLLSSDVHSDWQFTNIFWSAILQGSQVVCSHLAELQRWLHSCVIDVDFVRDREHAHWHLNAANGQMLWNSRWTLLPVQENNLR